MDERTIIQRIRLTPAERAVVAEQAEGMALTAASMIEACRNGTSEDVVGIWLKAGASVNYITEIMRRKVDLAVEELQAEGMA